MNHPAIAQFESAYDQLRDPVQQLLEEITDAPQMGRDVPADHPWRQRDDFIGNGDIAAAFALRHESRDLVVKIPLGGWYVSKYKKQFVGWYAEPLARTIGNMGAEQGVAVSAQDGVVISERADGMPFRRYAAQHPGWLNALQVKSLLDAQDAMVDVGVQPDRTGSPGNFQLGPNRYTCVDNMLIRNAQDAESACRCIVPRIIETFEYLHKEKDIDNRDIREVDAILELYDTRYPGMIGFYALEAVRARLEKRISS